MAPLQVRKRTGGLLVLFLLAIFHPQFTAKCAHETILLAILFPNLNYLLKSLALGR